MSIFLEKSDLVDFNDWGQLIIRREMPMRKLFIMEYILDGKHPKASAYLLENLPSSDSVSLAWALNKLLESLFYHHVGLPYQLPMLQSS